MIQVHSEDILQAVVDNFQLPDPIELTEVYGDWSNRLWRLRSNRAFALKIYPHGSDIQRIQRAAEFTTHLASQGVNVALPVKSCFGESIFEIKPNFHAILYPFVDGTVYQLDTPVPIKAIEKAGGSLAEINKVGRQFSQKLPSPSMLKPRNVLRIYKDVLDHIEDTKKSDREVSQAIRSKAKALANESFSWSQIRSLFPVNIHGDYHQGNLLFPDKESAPVVIDFDNCSHQPRIWELLLAITRLCIVESGDAFLAPLDLEKVSKFLKSYHRAYPLTEEEIDWLPRLGRHAAQQSTYYLEAYYLKRYPLRQSLNPPHTFEEWFWWDRNFAEIQSAFVQALR